MLHIRLMLLYSVARWVVLLLRHVRKRNGRHGGAVVGSVGGGKWLRHAVRHALLEPARHAGGHELVVKSTLKVADAL